MVWIKIVSPLGVNAEGIPKFRIVWEGPFDEHSVQSELNFLVTRLAQQNIPAVLSVEEAKVV